MIFAQAKKSGSVQRNVPTTVKHHGESEFMLLQAIRNVMPQAVHEAVDRRKFVESIRRFHTTSYPIGTMTSFNEFHEKCRSRYTANPLESDCQDLRRSFDQLGHFSLSNETTKALATQLAAKVYAADKWGDDDRYDGDVFKVFPEVEQILRQALQVPLQAVFGCDFKLFSATIYRSIRRSDYPTGSQLWHSDGYPGTSINVQVSLSETSKENGATRLLGWEDSIGVYRNSRTEIERAIRALDSDRFDREATRQIKVEAYEHEINSRWRDKVQQYLCTEAGTVVGFSPNLLHAGGFVEQGHERLVLMFRTYPNNRPLDYDHYHRNGTMKQGGVPSDPEF